METKEKCAGTCCPPLSQPANQDNGHCNLKTFEKTCDSKIPSSCCDKGSNKSTCFSSEEKSCDKSDRKEPNGSSCCAKRACNTDKAEEKRCSLGGRVVANPISAKEKSCSDNTRSETCSAKRCKTKTKKSYCGGGDLLNSENESSKSCCCSGSHDDHHLIMSDCASTTEKCCGADDCCCDSPSQYQAKTSCCTGCGEKGCCVGVVGSNVNPNRSTKRSTFYVEEICCATEISAIRSIVGPLDGVASVRVNATSKILYVDHDVGKISALNICDALNHERFGARIEKDAALETYAASSFVTSILAFVDQQTPVKDALVDFLANQDSTILQSFVVDVRGKRITLVHNALLMPASHIAQALLAALGVQAQVLKDGEESLVWEFDNIIEQENEEENAPASSHSMLRPTVALSGVLWVISMLSFIGGNWDYLKYVALLSVAFGLPPIAMKAAVSLRGCCFDVNCLMTFAAIGALALQDFTEAAAVTFLFALSEWLEVRATSRARNALSAILRLRPERANLIHPKTGELVVVPVGVVPVGALVSVKAGDKIPCDGVVIEGQSTVDESSLTGESRPVRKGPNDIVSGGTVNSGNTQMTIRTTASAEDSAVARLIRLVEEAQANRSETEKLVDKFASIYTPVIVCVAVAMCTIPWAWGLEIGAKWTELGLVLIVIACPCALIISTPVSYVAGLAATAQRGILVKGGAHLEALGLVKTVCFDKTGTLTEGKFQLLHFDVIGNKLQRKEAMEYLSLMENRASHPLARALVEGAEKEGVKIPPGRFVRNHTFLPGEGIVGTIDGEEVHVGNERLFQRLGLYPALSELERKFVGEWGGIGSVGFMSIGAKNIVCAYCVSDAIRAESVQVLRELKELGINTMMLTGDNNETAMSTGVSMGLAVDDIKSQLFPEQKLAIVSELKDIRSGGQSVFANICSTRKLVLMCGDGVNDAPALAAADVGVAMAGTALAMETADVTLLDSHLSKLVFSIKMGRRVIRKIKENVAFSLIVKFLVLGFALAGKAALWAAIASDVGAMLLVTLNSMMLLPFNDHNLEKVANKEEKLERNSDDVEEVGDLAKELNIEDK